PLRRSLRVRTTTALTTSPLRTAAPGRASFTVATMTSPMPAYRLLEPPSTRMHKISLAPVLSATLSRDSCWIPSTPASATPAHAPPGGVGGPWVVPRGDYLAFSRISVTRQRLVADIGRVFMSRTRPL